jgi:uncharacterized protein YmfQ (DUF2313 family)
MGAEGSMRVTESTDSVRNAVCWNTVGIKAQRITWVWVVTTNKCDETEYKSRVCACSNLMHL